MAKSYTNVIWKMQIVSILISIITICSTYKYGIYSAALSYLLSVLYIGYAYWKKQGKLSVCRVCNNIKRPPLGGLSQSYSILII